MAALQDLLQHFSRNGNDISITGANLWIKSGSGTTDGAVNGLGNLIVGYNELREDRNDDRTGSHNIIVGTRNNYTSYGGLVAGYSEHDFRRLTPRSAAETGNTASGEYSSVSGGDGNTASGQYSSVSGGGGNTASGDFSSVSGGTATPPAAFSPRSAADPKKRIGMVRLGRRHAL